ncbi:protein NRT1/ PTR FAMILY 5.2-like [Iris pallida]|uniref:Protein NRT1/ PTR FAMILY 5.2-like n=1 Tax=Iris pallida TaxID=29817 RepID=A0AAX6II19_IRIPA|nr:protein NRT1/ PTR FAMILY 5.2-like [Iris pallida]
MTESLETANGEYTKDGTVDLKGNPALRSKTGGWTACSFIVVYELFERMAYFGIASNLVLYLTDKFHQGTVEASNNVTNWVGTVYLTPILGAVIADAYLGRYWTFVIGSVIYLSGMCLISLAVSVSPLKPSSCASNCEPATPLQLGAFFGGLYVVAFGNGGTKPNISTMGAEQFDESDGGERTHRISFFNWWMFSIFLGILFANSVLVYIQDNVGWSVGYGLPTLGLFISVLIFLAGTPFYRHKLPQGSPLTGMSRVIVAALRKWRVPVPKDPKELHELDLEAYRKKGTFMIESTPSIRFLSKAAVRTGGEDTPWTLCPVTLVEETKQMLRLVPILLLSVIPSTILAQANTLFVKQGTTLQRHVGDRGFEIPPASLGTFITLPMLISVAIYDRYFMKAMRSWTKHPRGITLLQRIGIGMFMQIIVMAVASATERIRLGVARSHGLVESGKPVPASIFMILPQFVLMGISDAFFVVGKIEIFYEQAPQSMKSLGSSCTLTALGLGNVLSSLLLKLVSGVTERRGRGWVLNNLNASRLDYYYGFLTVLSVINFVAFMFVSRKFRYKAEHFESFDENADDQVKENS